MVPAELLETTDTTAEVSVPTYRLDDERVAAVYVVADLSKCAMRQAAGRAIHHEQAGGIAGGRGLLRDQVGRECVVEVDQAHQGRGPMATPE